MTDANTTTTDPKDPSVDAAQTEKDDAALWAEFDKADAAAAASDTDPDVTPPADDAGDVDAGTDAGAASAPGDASSTDSAAKAEGADAPSGDGQSGGDKPSDDAAAKAQADIWANATPEQRAAHEAAQAQINRLEQADRSNRGRLSAMQRQINDIMAQQRQQPSKAASTEAAKEQQGGSGQASGNEAEGFLASEDWKSFASEYPEVAGPLGKLVGQMQSEITQQRKMLSAIGEDRRTAALEEQATLLSDQHPDWQSLIADPGFADWLNAQPRHIREAAHRNGEEIVDAAEAADVVGRFKDHRATQQQGAGGDAQRQQPSQAGNGQGTQTTQALSGKRQRQLESASAARSRGPGVVSGIPEDGDPEVIWKQFDEMERRQQRA